MLTTRLSILTCPSIRKPANNCGAEPFDLVLSSRATLAPADKLTHPISHHRFAALFRLQTWSLPIILIINLHHETRMPQTPGAAVTIVSDCGQKL